MKTLEFCNGVLKLVDQTKLPLENKIVELSTYEEIADAIKTMIVRGAPAIGVTAVYGVVVAANSIDASSTEEFFNRLEKACALIKSTRPTAVNLFWAVDRVYKKALSNKDKSIEQIRKIIEAEARLMEKEDIDSNKAIGKFGNELIKQNSTILTHCNAGALATCDHGTALGVIRSAHDAGKNINVFADETRPYLQGSRLTVWELMEDNIPVTLICDNMAGHFMKEGLIDCVIVGADRISLNGDTANKIGTYSVAVLAKENNIPFYVAAPISTIDFTIDSGEQIPIEERNSDEVTHIKGVRIAPEGIKVRNPAFDVTPNKYISAIITDKGIIYPSFDENIIKYKNA